MFLLLTVSGWMGFGTPGMGCAQTAGGWIYKQYDASKESFEAFQQGKFTVRKFPAQTVQIAPKGTMPVVAQFGKSERLLAFNMRPLGLFSSDDGGKTWKELPFPQHIRTLNCAFGIVGENTVLLAGSYPASGDTENTNLRIWRSTDGGKSWYEGGNLDFSGETLPNGKKTVGDFFKPHVGYSKGPANYVAAYGRIIQISDGTVLLPFYIEANNPADDTYAALARSKDGGKSWGDISFIDIDFTETGVAELPGGELVAALRGQSQRRPRHLNLNSLTGFVRSADKGYTWSRYQLIAGDWDRVEHSSDVVVVDNDTLVVPTIARGDSKGRYQDFLIGVPVTVSYDRGKTWSQEYRIRVGVDTGKVSGFPSSVVLPDKTIVTLWGGSNRGVWGESRRGPLFATRWKLPPQMKKYVPATARVR